MATKPPARERILDAAYALFSERGIENTTTREIAQAAEVNEVTIFRHFENKDGLVHAILDGFFADRLRFDLDNLAFGADLEGDLLSLTRRIMGIHREREDFFRFVLNNVAMHPEYSQVMRRWQTRMLDRVGAELAPWCEPLGLDPEATVLDFIAPMVMRTISRVQMGFTFFDDETFARNHARLFARLLQRPETP